MGLRNGVDCELLGSVEREGNRWKKFWSLRQEIWGIFVCLEKIVAR